MSNVGDTLSPQGETKNNSRARSPSSSSPTKRRLSHRQASSPRHHEQDYTTPAGSPYHDPPTSASASSPSAAGKEAAELADALEALQAARDQQKKILRDVRLQRLGDDAGTSTIVTSPDDAVYGGHSTAGVGSSRVIRHSSSSSSSKLSDNFKHQSESQLSVGGFSQVSADGAFKGTKQATGKLRRELDAVQEKLLVGSYEAAQNTKRLRGHVALLKQELSGMELEVDTLQNAVDNVREGCRLTEAENKRVGGRLDEIYSERDKLVAGLAEFISNTGDNLKAVEAERQQYDSELARLREQNDYLRLQLIPKRRFPK